MSGVLIGQYLNDLSRLKQVSGAYRESVVRKAFKDLIDLLQRVIRVSMETQSIVEAMRKEA